MSSRSAIHTTEKKKLADIPSYAWVILWIALLAGVSAPFNQFKVPPVMPVLMTVFQFDLSMAGMLMSIFAITGLALALPAGIIFQKLGARLTGIIALSCLLIGSALGALATSALVLFTSRLIEGIGMGLIAVTAPAVIASWFPAERRGLPMGVWATWVSLGGLMIYNLAPMLNRWAGWQAVWWAGAGFALLALLLFGLFMRLPPTDDGLPAVMETARSNQAFSSLREIFTHADIWLLALSFGCFNFVVIGVIATYFPTFLTTVRGYDMAGASFITSLKMLVVVSAAPVAGWLSDRVGSPKRLILVASLFLSLLMIFPFNLDGWWISAWMVALGILSGAIPTATFSVVPELMGKTHLAGLGMAVIMLGQNLGQLLGPVIFARLVEHLGWVVAGYWMIPVLLIGIVATWFTKMR